MDKQLLDLAVGVLASGDDTGCDGLVVVGEKEYHALRKYVGEKTGQWHGCVEPFNDDDFDDDLEDV